MSYIKRLYDEAQDFQRESDYSLVEGDEYETDDNWFEEID